MRVLAVLLLIGGCGGGEGDADGGATDEDTDGTPAEVDPCAGIPNYQLDEMDCEQIGVAWHKVIDTVASCTTKDDCTAHYPDCTKSDEVDCWYPANTCANDVIDAYITRMQSMDCVAENAGCVGCGSAPPVDCVDGRCTLQYAR